MVGTLQKSILIVGSWLVMVAVVGAQETVNVAAKLVHYPDLIVHNGKIVTMDDLDPFRPPGNIFQAMAIREDLIQFLGTDAEILSLAGPQTRKIDLGGRTVVPGLIDTHNHLHNGFVSRWADANPREVFTIMREFNVSGKTSYEQITKGIEVRNVG